MSISDPPSSMTPLAPSVEKAYYRKCIQLKRRLNEVEAANDEAKIRRSRLDRGVMKMRLERAFLLDELRKRMEYNVDASEGSAEEGMTTVCSALHITVHPSHTLILTPAPARPPTPRQAKATRRRAHRPFQPRHIPRPSTHHPRQENPPANRPRRPTPTPRLLRTPRLPSARKRKPAPTDEQSEKPSESRQSRPATVWFAVYY